jgi:deoxyribodipyrimidine photo-lyase
MALVPDLRIRTANDASVRSEGDYVLYWMTAFRRIEWNFGLQRAIEWSRDLKKSLLVFEALRCGYQWASDRIHLFVIQGMRDNARRLAGRKSVLYYPYLESKRGAGKGLLAALARRACVVVSDDFPCFFLPRMVKAAGPQLPVRFELVDSNGILPVRAADKVFRRAHDFRRFLQKNLRSHLEEFPEPDPLSGLRLPPLEELPRGIQQRWPAADPELSKNAVGLADYPIDHNVAVAPITGGAEAAAQRLGAFLHSKLSLYGSERNEPEQDATSGLSPYLHFGHISAHQVFRDLMDQDGWKPDNIADKATGSSEGWWGASPEVESFLDELITWREVGYNMCWHQGDYDKYESLPDWARKTLQDHVSDPREHVYSLEEFEAAETHDELWNAAQRQLVREGRIHNYLRMLWGKKILEWSAAPRDALDVMIELNNRYALDGRDPNSYSGIFWCLGRYDRAWGPERPIFGKVRYMSSKNTARKVRVKQYIANFAAIASDDPV